MLLHRPTDVVQTQLRQEVRRIRARQGIFHGSAAYREISASRMVLIEVFYYIIEQLSKRRGFFFCFFAGPSGNGYGHIWTGTRRVQGRREFLHGRGVGIHTSTA